MFLIDFAKYGYFKIYMCRVIAHFKRVGVTEFPSCFLTLETALRSRGTKRFLVQMVGKTQAGFVTIIGNKFRYKTEGLMMHVCI